MKRHVLWWLSFTGILLSLALPPACGQECLVPMSDGTKLVTVVHLPDSGGPQWPAILERTPYPRSPKDGGWNACGIVYVAQSVRGRNGSEGTFRPFADEGWGEHKDGADTVRWILEQPWSNGKVGTYGGSAPGLTSALLSPATTKLSCQIIQEASGNFARHLVYQGGVFRKSLVEGWLAAGVQTPDYAAIWRAEPPSSSYWRFYDADAVANEITSPGLHVGGWWDIFANGTIDLFLRRQYQGGEGARGNQKLIMRPSAHGPWGAQDLKFPANFDEFRITPYRKLFAQHWLCGADNGITDEPAVRYYTIGDDTAFSGPGWEWRTADTWPPFPVEPTAYYIHTDGRLSPDRPAEEAVPRTFAFDPQNPVPTLGGQNLVMAYGPYDQRPVSSRPDVLTFVSSPLDAPLETTGHFFVRLYVSSDAPDTDFTAKLVDMYPPGDDREILMLDNIVRVKYRNGYDKPEPPLIPTDVIEIQIDLGHISWIFNTNHRVGLQIASCNYPRFDVNPNNGREFPGAETPSRIAHNSVFMSQAYPSAVMLPIRKKD